MVSVLIISSHNNNIAQRALKEAQYTQLRSFELVVMLDSTKRSLKTKGKLFVKNIGLDTKDSDLHRMFSIISPQLYVSIRRDEDGKSFGFGFVHYFNPEDVEKALQHFQGQTELELAKWGSRGDEKRYKDGKKLDKENSERRNSLYLKNLKPTIDKETLERDFSKFGSKVLFSSLRPWIAENKIISQYGFIVYEKEEDTEIVFAKAQKDHDIKALFTSKEEMDIGYYDPEYSSKHNQPNKSQPKYKNTCNSGLRPVSINLIPDRPVNSTDKYPMLLRFVRVNRNNDNGQNLYTAPRSIAPRFQGKKIQPYVVNKDLEPKVTKSINPVDVTYSLSEGISNNQHDENSKSYSETNKSFSILNEIWSITERAG